jgi:hypothetical protein
MAPSTVLTIEAGARIEAAAGTSIVVPRTSRIVAEGTLLEPVVFTCTGASKFAGCWSGIVIQGYAPVNTGSATSPPARGNGIGGCRELTNTETGTSYGGCDPSDSSGVLRFVRIEFAGSSGLRLEGVGNRTSLDFIQVNRSEGTGLSVQGGTANLKHVVLTANAGGGWHWTTGWTGKAQFVVVQGDLAVSGGVPAAVVGENGVEQDATPRSAPQIFNLSILTATTPAIGSAPPAVLLRRGTAGSLRNVLLYRSPIGVAVSDAATCAQIGSGGLSLARSVIAGAASVGDPDPDPSPCGGFASPQAEASWFQAAQNANLVITDPAVVQGMVLGNNLVTMDGRTRNLALSVAPPADGFFDPSANYVGAIPPANAAANNIPWQSGWITPSPVPSVDPGLQLIASGLSGVLYVTAPPGDLSRIFAVQQNGTIRVIRNDTLLSTPFLDLGGITSGSGERGLLSMAFHPSYATNGRFFVFYTDLAGALTVARYQVSADPNVADAASGSVVLSIPHSAEANHNGGLLKFGPDGYLYIGTGDGGGGGDPFGNGQDSTALLGKILRIDVDGGIPYAVPTSNPFVGRPPAAPEVWNYGLRNPWRYSFDRVTGDMYIADVGQDAWEEVNFAAAGTGGGRNYGWNVMEGTHCFSPSTGCVTTGKTLPIYEYGHQSGTPTGCSITGGYVYRGARMPNFYGRYFFGDLCGGWIRSFRVVGGVFTDLQDHTPRFGSVSGLTSFGEDGRGELYVTGGNAVYRISP